jgi:hypothetical protein
MCVRACCAYMCVSMCVGGRDYWLAFKLLRVRLQVRARSSEIVNARCYAVNCMYQHGCLCI